VIGKLERVPLREVWKHEALDFTKWLQDNIDILNEVVNLELASAEREQSAGDFSVDIVAEDKSGDTVIIENQLGRSDHDHLGKLVTYLSMMEAKAAVWIVADPRPEHVRAVSWLNDSSAADFYLLKVEAIRIGESEPAPLLTLITGPSEEGKQVGKTKKEMAERDGLRHRFWSGLLQRARERTKLHASISPSRGNWIGTGAGRSGLAYSYSVRQHDAQVELYIDRGADAEEENKDIFGELERSRDRIEAEFGGELSWQRLEGKRACRIAKRLEIGGYRDEEEWPRIHEGMIDAMMRLEKALSPFVAKLKLG
jgi:hypothetical protein